MQIDFPQFAQLPVRAFQVKVAGCTPRQHARQHFLGGNFQVMVLCFTQCNAPKPAAQLRELQVGQAKSPMARHDAAMMMHLCTRQQSNNDVLGQ